VLRPAPGTEENVVARMRWFRFLTHHRQYRRRRAYFRPTDTSALDAALVPLSESIVTVRFADVAGAESPFAGQRLYRLVGHRTSLTFVRPERDFDFLE
jgi:hypothetical protein